jgi:hypothetical protein
VVEGNVCVAVEGNEEQKHFVTFAPMPRGTTRRHVSTGSPAEPRLRPCGPGGRRSASRDESCVNGVSNIVAASVRRAARRAALGQAEHQYNCASGTDGTRLWLRFPARRETAFMAERRNLWH